MKFFVQTFGCQMNVADSDEMAAQLARSGLEPCGDINDADVIVVNTCAVRQHAEHRALSFVGRLSPLKKKNKNLKIIFAGCVAQRLGKEMKSRFPIVDGVVGAQDIGTFPEMLQKLSISAAEFHHPITPPLRRSVSAFVTIMRGCENFCSYCIVPHVRGKEESRPGEEIIAEIESLARQGIKEVTLLGQNVNSYRGAFGGGSIDFPDLLSHADAVEGLERIRFMTNHPKDLSEKLTDQLSRLPKVCEHIHLPLQSGSDRILRAMNRNYTAADYRRKVDRLRGRVAGISLTTDILVGFPGETEEDFKETLALVKELRFDFLFAFKYSPRPGTEAARLIDDIPRETKEERLARMLEASGSISAQKNATLVGTSQEVLVEGREKELLQGRTRTNRKVFFSGVETLSGKLVPVKITASKLNSLTGTMPAQDYA